MEEKMNVYRCRHSGLYFPPDYVENWGRKYGIGLGPVPVSECLNTHYHLPQAEAYYEGSGVMMHPVGNTHGGLDMVTVTKEEYEANKAICAHEDRTMLKRVDIIIAKQKANLIDRKRDELAAARAI